MLLMTLVDINVWHTRKKIKSIKKKNKVEEPFHKRGTFTLRFCDFSGHSHDVHFLASIVCIVYQSFHYCLPCNYVQGISQLVSTVPNPYLLSRRADNPIRAPRDDGETKVDIWGWDDDDHKEHPPRRPGQLHLRCQELPRGRREQN